jgi:hypothetical protein
MPRENFFEGATDTPYEVCSDDRGRRNGNDGTDSRQLAIPTDFNLWRHVQREGVKDAHIEQLEAELAIDKELGLLKQAETTAAKALQHDIDHLTSSHDYRQVSHKILEKLFKIPQVKWNCFKTTLVNFTKGFISGCWALLLCTFFSLQSLHLS